MTSVPLNSEAMAPEKDTLYYLMPVTLKIEGTLFKIPRFSLTSNSPIFEDMFMIPQDGITQMEGSNDGHPIEIERVSKDDFRHLLEVILPLDIPLEIKLSKEGWIAVLGLADMWEMDKIRLHSIEQLTNLAMGSVEKIVLAKKYHVPQWLRSGYTELINQHEMVSFPQSESIGYPSAVKVFQLREIRLRGYSYSQGLSNMSLEDVFADELAREEAIYHTYASSERVETRPES